MLADQIVCVAKKWLERECLTPSLNQRKDIKDSDCAAEIHSIYNQMEWRTRQGTLKTYTDNIGINYQDGIYRDFCAMFVYVVWSQACFCLGGVDGYEDLYLYKSARVYDDTPPDTISMRLGTIASGKTRVDKIPTLGSAFVRRRDNLSKTSGHAGIIVDVQEGQFTCIEGNGSQTAQTGLPFEIRTYTDSDIGKYSMYFIHIEDTPVIQAGYPREDGYCCPPPERKEIEEGPCTSKQKPAGDGWTPTDTTTFQNIISGGDPNQNAKVYTDQGFEFSQEWCWMRTKPTTTSGDCSTYTCPNGYKKRTPTKPGEANIRIGRRDGTILDPITGENRMMTQTDVCCEPNIHDTNNPCPDVKIQNCVQAIRVSANTFNPKSVPHFSVMYKNRLMGADITGSKWTFQTVGPRNGEGLGSALALPPPKILDANGQQIPKYSSVDGDAIPDTAYSGFGTFSDVNGNLIVIVPEWMGARLNSLIGRAEEKLPSILGPQGFYQVNCPAHTGGGAVHAQAVDANYIVGSTDVIDGMNPVRPATNSNSLVRYQRDKYGNIEKDRFGYYIQSWVDENLFAGGVKLPFELSWTSIISNNNDYTGLLNQIELNPDKNPRGKLTKPILVVLKSAPPPFNWIDFAKTVITIAASFAPLVGIPPQVFTQALKAIDTIESIALGKTDVLSSVVRIAGLVTSLLPESLRGEINNLIKDVAGETIVNAVNDGKQYLQSATNFLTDIKSAPTKAFQSLGFDKSAADLMQKKMFGALLPAIENLSPSWYDFASDYAKNLKGDFDKGFQDGVKLLHSMETIKSTQQFGRYTASGKSVEDIIAGGSSLDIPEFQNLMITGLAGTVMASTPGITKVMAAIMQTRDILVDGSESKGISGQTNISEISSVLKIANGFMGDPKDFDRLTLEALMRRVTGLTNKGVTKFVLPPSLSMEQQECWGRELNQCFGIIIIGTDITYKKDVPPTKDNPPPVSVPPCIRTVNGSFMYCPPVTCKTGLSDDYNLSANYTLRCQNWMWREEVPGSKAKQDAATQILTLGEKVAGFDDRSGIYTRKFNGVLYQFGADDQGNLAPKYPAIDIATGKQLTNLNGYLCEMVEVPVVTTTPQLKKVTQPVTESVAAKTPIASEQQCTVMYPARVSTGVPDRWFAQIAGQWVEIIDCCPTQMAKDCCDETQSKLAQMKLDIAKITELVGRNQAGEKCPECDLSEIKKLIADLPKKGGISPCPDIIIPNEKYNDAELRREMREGFAEMRAMIGQMKQYDVSKDILEIKELVKAIKIADCKAVSEEVAALRRLIEAQIPQKTVSLTPQTGTSPAIDTKYFDTKYEELKNLINSRSQISQHDYSAEFTQMQKELEWLRSQFPITTTTIEKEIQNPNTSTTEKENLRLLLIEQTDIFSKKISDLEKKLTKPCEECTELAKLQKQIDGIRELIIAIKPSTNTTTIREVSNPADKAEIERLVKERDGWLKKYDEMHEAFTTSIEEMKQEQHDTSDMEEQFDYNIDRYNDLLTKFDAKIKELSVKTDAPPVKIEIPPVRKETPPTKTTVPPGEKDDCPGCPKVVESHTRTIYEYPPSQQQQSAPCNDCE